MKPVPIHKVTTELSRLIERACAGEDVVIAKGKQPLVRLVPIEEVAPQRKFGAPKHQLVVDDSFFDSLPDEELEAWEWVAGRAS